MLPFLPTNAWFSRSGNPQSIEYINIGLYFTAFKIKLNQQKMKTWMKIQNKLPQARKYKQQIQQEATDRYLSASGMGGLYHTLK